VTHERINTALNIGDHLCLWVLVLAATAVLSLLALRADRDPPSLISPACITTPTKAVK
jgi:hypothetical protein